MINISRAENGQSFIDGNLYKKAVVEREPHRIDILIKGEGHCIIIENKINDAIDMDRQLPRYYEKMQDDGYLVDAVVYLTKTPEKMPDISSWHLWDKRNIIPLIAIIPANVEDGEISLLNNWIKPCCEKALDPDCISSLRQYGALVEYLTPDFKKAKAMRELLGYMHTHPYELKNESIPTEILQEIPAEMARELRETVRKLIHKKGFTLNVGSWSTNSCVINLDNADNQIWVYCCADEEAAYRVGFRGRWHVYDTTDYWVNWYPISETDVEVTVDQNGAYLAKNFKFGEEGEKELLHFISKLLDCAKEIMR